MEWQDLGPARTRFVGDRMTEATWRDHDYIADLLRIERGVVSGEPSRRAGYTAIRHVIETAAIREEIMAGRYMPPVEFHAKHQAQEDLARLRATERERDIAEVERDAWGHVTRFRRRL